ncbi:MAG: Flp family type IVb pilin [Candidatus Nanopelagicales bacterium]
MFMTLRKRLDRSEGASAVEYAILIAAISAIIVAIVFVLGGRVKSAFSKTNSCIGAQGSTTACGASQNNNNNDDDDKKDCKKGQPGCKKD